MDTTVRIPALAVGHDDRRPDRCGRCGCQGFNRHQRATKALKDPRTPRAAVVRFICKRCRKTTRLYPEGVDARRQTIALRNASVLLYWVGLSYDGIREFLGHFGCPLSKATVWANVSASGLLGNRHRLRADPGSLVVQPLPNGAVARLLLRSRAADVWLECTEPRALVLRVGAPDLETARLLQRRLSEATRTRAGRHGGRSPRGATRLSGRRHMPSIAPLFSVSLR